MRARVAVARVAELREWSEESYWQTRFERQRGERSDRLFEPLGRAGERTIFQAFVGQGSPARRPTSVDRPLFSFPPERALIEGNNISVPVIP
jgi:hypothetical protein